MKEAPRVIVFVRGAEKISPTEHDLFWSESGYSANTLQVAHCWLSGYKRFCYARHDIDVPEGAIRLTPQFFGPNGWIWMGNDVMYIDLPRPVDKLEEEFHDALVKSEGLLNLRHLAKTLAEIARREIGAGAL
jgi:hypothetical protein